MAFPSRASRRRRERWATSCCARSHRGCGSWKNSYPMAKAKSIYSCTECGGQVLKWQGQCPHCQAWNTLVETVAEAAPSANRFGLAAEAGKLQRLSEIEAREESRVPTGIEEFDRVLGGGLVPGGVVLLGGDPGIGKSTLLLQALAQLSRSCEVLYISGEESA